MPRFLIVMWSPRPEEAREALKAASIETVESDGPNPRGSLGHTRPTAEIKALVEAHSASAALALARAAVRNLAAVAGAVPLEDVEPRDDDASQEIEHPPPK